ncbi:distal flagellar hook-filament junction protein [Aliarcobacter cibarius]|uniref:Distal flagellar hook-filament junction protein n=1 Tax=Aliarcobacter cibarius TaxID=255507 RepID=A0A7L5JN00_9BACT|nr:flagellar hook-associated protein FlgL [Aliarcobacter cibarius]QKJ26604.1 distal flagellar hook-filament junction protein [Aliarcobacter cibarius]
MISQVEQTIYRLNNLDKTQQKLNYQLSTKQQLENGSDDSVLFGRITSAQDKVRTFEGIKTIVERTKVQNDMSDSSLKEAKNLLTFIKSELMKANTDTTGDDGLKSIAVVLAGTRENLLTLANTQVEGEYLFSGSDSSKKPFVEVNGKISYVGDNKLRRVAVEEGSYRDRGVNGFDAMMYSSSVAYKGNDLIFTETDRILDQDGNEWKLDMNSATPPSPALPLTLRKYDLDGNSTINTITPVTFDGTTNTYTITTPSDVGTKFEAKTSIFDLMNSVINTLNMVDEVGNPISRDIVRDNLAKQIDAIDQSFDDMNITHADLGAKNKVFETALESIDSKLVQYKKLEEALSSADLTEVAIQIKALELTYTAMYSTVARTNELSLVNFMK